MIKQLLVPLDGTELADRAMSESIALARQLGASIVGFIAEPEMPAPNPGADMARYRREIEAHEVAADTHAHQVLSAFGEQARAAGVAFSGRHARTGGVDRAIAELADELDDAMIVMVTHGRGPFAGLLFGSHTRNVMGLTKKPLLVLH